MTLWQIITLCWQHISGWAAAHPGKAVLVCIGIAVGSSITAQRLELSRRTSIPELRFCGTFLHR